MKTKVLLIGAALGLAVATASADAVYSSNVVGYVNVDLVAGWNMIANPLDSGNNVLSSVIAEAPDETAVYKFVDGNYVIASYIEDDGGWDNDFSMKPGEGVFLYAPEAFTATFVGEVKAGFHSVPLPAGWSLIASPTPVAGDLDEIDLTSAVEDGDTVYKFENGNYTIAEYVEEDGGWDNIINVGVAEGFFLSKATASVWTRGFEIK